jgi:hypothetical protein
VKLIFLGDSFTEGTGIDFEYGIQQELLENNQDIYFSDRSKLKKDVQIFINNFRKNNVWTKLLCNELNLEEENRSFGGGGLDSIFIELLQSEIINKNTDRFYIIGLPFLHGGRILNSINSNEEINDILNKNFKYIVLNSKVKDLKFYQKHFNNDFFKFYYLNFMMTVINYLKNKKIDFLFLPTWENNIKEHFFKKPVNFKEDSFERPINFRELFFKNKGNFSEKTKDQNVSDIFIALYDKFVFSELGKQMNFLININLITKLPCGHADIKSQYIIKDMYKKYIKEKLDEINIFR